MLPIIVATLAPIINCVEMFPQLYKTVITKSVKDLSFYSLTLILIANVLWLMHGYFIGDVAIFLSGGISMLINMTLLALYIILHKNKRRSSKHTS